MGGKGVLGAALWAGHLHGYNSAYHYKVYVHVSCVCMFGE